MEDTARLAAFEAMLASLTERCAAVSSKMDELKQAGKEKTVTYKQLMAKKLELQNMLAVYKAYGLI